MEENEEKLEQIHFRIPKKLKREWKQQFKDRGHSTYKSGVMATVFNYLHLQNLNLTQTDPFMEEIKTFMGYLEKIKIKLKEKMDVINEALSEVSDAVIDAANYEEMKELLLDKSATYQPIAITFLASLTGIPGEKLLPVLKRMNFEGLIDLTDKTEWCLK